MIAIAGGTGNVGSRVVEHLVSAGNTVRVLTRDPNVALRRWSGRPVEIVRVNFDSPGSMQDALTGSSRLLLATGFGPSQVSDEKKLIDAAVASGTGYIVALSLAQADHPISNMLMGCRRQVEAHLRAQQVQFTLLRSAPYLDAVVEQACQFLLGSVWGGAVGLGRAAFVDVRDVAEVASVVLREGPARHHGRYYELTGPAALTMQRIASIQASVLGRQASYLQRTRDQQSLFLMQLGIPLFKIELTVALDDLLNADIFHAPTGTVENLLGRRPYAAAASIASQLPRLASLFPGIAASVTSEPVKASLFSGGTLAAGHTRNPQ